MNVTLNNGVIMPQVGLGVFKVENGASTVDTVKEALKLGYRSIDTAAIYRNEEGVGQAIKESGIPRDELFITTKVWNSEQGYDKTLAAFHDSLTKLGLDYIDLYLVHWPLPDENNYIDTYRALETLYREGKVRAIGVSNFEIDHLQRLLAECDIVPVVNQVECHPFFNQAELREFCRAHNIHLQAWSPLRRGGEVFENETITTIAARHGKTPAQVILRWHLQHDVIIIPKSVTPTRIAENFDVFDFTLSADEMTAIDALTHADGRFGPHPNEMYAK